MTEPTQGYSSQVPNTVIGNRPAGLDITGTIERAVSGHQEILTAIRDHAGHDKTLRELRRQEANAADIHWG